MVGPTVCVWQWHVGGDGSANVCHYELSYVVSSRRRVRMLDHTRSRRTDVLHCVCVDEFAGGRRGWTHVHRRCTGTDAVRCAFARGGITRHCDWSATCSRWIDRRAGEAAVDATSFQRRLREDRPWTRARSPATTLKARLDSELVTATRTHLAPLVGRSQLPATVTVDRRQTVTWMMLTWQRVAQQQQSHQILAMNAAQADVIYTHLT